MRPLLRQPLLLVRQFGPLKPKTAVSVRSFSQLSAVRWPSPPASASIQCQFSVLGALRLPRRAYSTTPGKDDPTKPAPESETKSEPTTTKEPTLEDSKKAALDDHPASKPPGGVPVPPKFDINNLPSVLESRRTELSKRFSHAMNDLQAAVFVAGKRLNDMTGYSAIEQMRKAIEAQEAHVRATRAEVKAAKEAFQSAISRRSASQREVNELLQRKHAWSTTDLERFTSLYRSDHANEQEEAAAEQRLSKAEQAADEAQSQLTKSILTRYHEEQIWSDKIRSASTWVTWALMGFNVFLFIIVQLGLEPWRRRRLVGGFEEKVREVIQEESLRSAMLRLEHAQPAETAAMIASEKVVEENLTGEGAAVVEEIIGVVAPADPTDTTKISDEVLEAIDQATAGDLGTQVTLPSLQELKEMGFKEGVKEAVARSSVVAQAKWQELGLFSETAVTLSRADVTTMVIESAAAGAVVAAGIVALVVNNSR